METFHYLIGQQTPHMAWWQMCNRAVLVLLYAVVLYRVAPRRSLTGLSALDIVLTVVMGSSLSRALTGNAPLLPTLAATALLVALYTGLSALAPRSDFVSRLTKGRSVRLIRNGEIDWKMARRSNLGPRDIDEELRMKGLRRLDEVEEAYLERNGAVSIIKASK